MSGTTFHVIQTTGTFQVGETISSNISEDLVVQLLVELLLYTELLLLFILEWKMLIRCIVKILVRITSQIFFRCKTVGFGYSRYIIKSVGGSFTMLQVRGTNTGFNSDLKVGDLVEVMDTGGTVRRFEVGQINSDTLFTTVETFPVTVLLNNSKSSIKT